MRKWDNTTVYQGPRDLEKLGIEILTGEACNLGMRILCDLTEDGVKLIQDFFRADPMFESWNSRGVKSIMLPREMFELLWIFAAVQDRVKYVFRGGYVWSTEWTTTTIGENSISHPNKDWKSELYAINSEEEMNKLREMLDSKDFYIERLYRFSNSSAGADNQHQMSGRTK